MYRKLAFISILFVFATCSVESDPVAEQQTKGTSTSSGSASDCYGWINGKNGKIAYLINAKDPSNLKVKQLLRNARPIQYARTAFDAGSDEDQPRFAFMGKPGRNGDYYEYAFEPMLDPGNDNTSSLYRMVIQVRGNDDDSPLPATSMRGEMVSVDCN